MKNPSLDFSKIDMNALREEVKHVEEYLNKMPPEERRRLEEEVMREVEKLSDEDIQQIMDLSQQVMQPTRTPPPSTPAYQPPTPTKQDVRDEGPKPKESLVQEIKKMFNTIVEKIESVISKITSLHRVSSAPTDEQQWLIHRPALEINNSLARRILNPTSMNLDIFINHLAKDESAELLTNIKKLHKALVQHEPLIQIPDIMGLKDPATLGEEPTIDPITKKRSMQAVKALLNDLKLLSLPSLNNQLENMMNKVAPKEPAKPATSGPTPQLPRGREPKARPTTFASPSYDMPQTIRKPQDMHHTVQLETSRSARINLIQEPLMQVKKTIEGNATLRATVANKNADQLIKDIDPLTSAALENCREHCRKVVKAMRLITEPTNQELSNLEEIVTDSKVIVLNEQLKKAIDKLTPEAAQYSSLKRTYQTCDTLCDVYKELISTKDKETPAKQSEPHKRLK